MRGWVRGDKTSQPPRKKYIHTHTHTPEITQLNYKHRETAGYALPRIEHRFASPFPPTPMDGAVCKQGARIPLLPRANDRAVEKQNPKINEGGGGGGKSQSEK